MFTPRPGPTGGQIFREGVEVLMEGGIELDASAEEKGIGRVKEDGFHRGGRGGSPRSRPNQAFRRRRRRGTRWQRSEDGNRELQRGSPLSYPRVRRRRRLSKRPDFEAYIGNPGCLVARRCSRPSCARRLAYHPVGLWLVRGSRVRSSIEEWCRSGNNTPKSSTSDKV